MNVNLDLTERQKQTIKEVGTLALQVAGACATAKIQDSCEHHNLDTSTPDFEQDELADVDGDDVVVKQTCPDCEAVRTTRFDYNELTCQQQLKVNKEHTLCF